MASLPYYSGLKELYTSGSTNEYKIEFYSFSTQETFIFPAFVTDFNDSFKSNWTQQEIYGKMDPISTFKNTTRAISLSFDIPSSDVIIAIENLTNVDKLIKGLYPIYTDVKVNASLGVSTITAPPLYKIKFANLIANVQNGDGLLGYLNGFDFKPDFTSGHFIQQGTIYPKLLKASLTFNVLHQHALGSIMNGNKPIPRIIVGERKVSKAFAHGYDKGTILLPSPPPPREEDLIGTEVDLYVVRRLESGGNLAPYADGSPRVGSVQQLSFQQFSGDEGHRESWTIKSFETLQIDGKPTRVATLINKDTGEEYKVTR